MSTLPSETFSNVTSVPTNSVPIVSRFKSFISTTLASTVLVPSTVRDDLSEAGDDLLTVCSEDSVYMMDHPEVFNYDAVISQEDPLDFHSLTAVSSVIAPQTRRRIQRAPQPVLLCRAGQLQTAGYFAAQYDQIQLVTAYLRKKASWSRPSNAPMFSVTVCSLKTCQATSANVNPQQIVPTQHVAPLAFREASTSELQLKGIPTHFKKVDRALKSSPSNKSGGKTIMERTLLEDSIAEHSESEAPTVISVRRPHHEINVQQLAKELLQNWTDLRATPMKESPPASEACKTPSRSSMRWRLRNESLLLMTDNESDADGTISAWMNCMQIQKDQQHVDGFQPEILERALELAADLPDNERNEALRQLLHLCDDIEDQLGCAQAEEMSVIDV